MDISDELRCLFSGTVETKDESYVVEIPAQEVRLGDIQAGETYRVAVLASPSVDEDDATETESRPEQGPAAPQEPPVSEGERREVEIEDLGEQGDGITRVERGFVVIVPDTEQGERVMIEITDVRKNVAFASVIKRLSYYD